ncbi:MAG: sigma-70 family RNA polymerase sigma factor [Bacilli bacterium]|nr:sigma-70 family RNA polymerase sigma factor [Bacilli bacterium]
MTPEEIIEANKGLILNVCKKFYNADFEDLFQVGVGALLQAYKNYKSDGTTKFSTYAYPYIYGAMYTLVSNNNPLKINQYLLKVRKLAERTRYDLAQKYGKIPTNQELALYLELDEEIINQATSCMEAVKSLDEQPDNERSYYETVGCRENISMEERIDIFDSLDRLDDREREIIKARYYKDMTQSEVARTLNMTQVMVSRYEKKGIEKMRQYMTM